MNKKQAEQGKTKPRQGKERRTIKWKGLQEMYILLSAINMVEMLFICEW